MIASGLRQRFLKRYFARRTSSELRPPAGRTGLPWRFSAQLGVVIVQLEVTPVVGGTEECTDGNKHPLQSITFGRQIEARAGFHQFQIVIYMADVTSGLTVGQQLVQIAVVVLGVFRTERLHCQFLSGVGNLRIPAQNLQCADISCPASFRYHPYASVGRRSSACRRD